MSVFRIPRRRGRQEHQLTKDQWLADLAITKHDGISVPDLAQELGRPETVAYRVAEQLLAKHLAYVVDGLLYESREHYQAVRRSFRS